MIIEASALLPVSQAQLGDKFIVSANRRDLVHQVNTTENK